MIGVPKIFNGSHDLTAPLHGMVFAITSYEDAYGNASQENIF